VDGQTIVVLDGDQTGQELLDEALRVLAPESRSSSRASISHSNRGAQRRTRSSSKPRGRSARRVWG
jgi:isocitrate/isopropylmalate dehydrogenase